MSDPTLFKKLLGKNYKWWFLLKFRFKSRSSSLLNNTLFALGQLLMFVSILLTWWLANDKVIDFELQQKWTYFVMGELFFSVIFIFSEMLAFDYIRGGHIKDLLRPQNFLVLKFFETYGESSLQNLVKVLLLLIVMTFMFLNNQLTFFDLRLFLVTILLLPISLIILYLLGFIVATAGFFMTQIHGVALNYGFLISFFSGKLFPIGLIINNFYTNLFNPFAFTFYHPMQIYLGKYSPLEIFYIFLGGIIWCVLLYFLAKFVFKMGLKRNESVGL